VYYRIGSPVCAAALGTLVLMPARERYTDVYVKENGTWMALSAQETEIAP
jgi:hypothetical protein